MSTHGLGWSIDGEVEDSAQWEVEVKGSTPCQHQSHGRLSLDISEIIHDVRFALLPIHHKLHGEPSLLHVILHQ